MAFFEDTRRHGIAKLTEGNYHIWKQRMEMWLTRENLWHVIHSPAPTPVPVEWERDDRLARATIGLSVDDRYLVDLKHEHSAKDVWTKLENIHQRNSLGSRLLLYRKIFTARYTPNSSMTDHISNILDSASKLEDRGYPIINELLCSAILGSLPREYNSMITAIEGRKSDEISIDYIREKIMEEYERHNKNPEEHQRPVKALYTAGNKYNTRTNQKKIIKCYYCHKVGHVRNDCRLLKQHSSHSQFTNRQQSNQKPPDKQQVQHSKLTYEPELEAQFSSQTLEDSDTNATNTNHQRALTTALYQENHSTDSWVIDTGASQHMSRRRTNFISLQKLEEPIIITTASGEAHKVTEKGQCILTLNKENNRTNSLSLENVYYVPTLTEDLISVAQLDKHGYDIQFSQAQCWIHLNNANQKLGEIHNGLYRHIAQHNFVEHEVLNQANLCTHIWHQRLGHRNLHDITLMEKDNNAEGLHITPCDQDAICDVCQKTKKSNQKFNPVKHTTSTKPFQLLHTDLCGPISPSTLGNNNYALSIIDDYSRYATIYIIRNKDQTFQKVQEYIEQGITKFNRRPNSLRSDGGGEFANKRMEDYLRSIGTQHQITLPYVSQQNGVAERHNRTLMDTTRALIKQANLPKYMWGEMASTATYLINRYRRQTATKTPFELWNSIKPNISHIRVIGTKCYYLNNHPSKKKLDDRGYQGILIGFGNTHHNYRIWNQEDSRIVESRSVTFERENCPNSVQKPEIEANPEDDINTIHLSPRRTENKQPVNTPIVRVSQRTNKGTPPAILSYENLGKPTNTTQDWFNEGNCN